MRRFAVPTIAALAVVALAGVAQAAPSASGLTKVWFQKDGVLASVDRPVQGVEPAIRALLAGPTVAERAAGFRSLLPKGVVVRDVSVAKQVVTIDLAALAVGTRDRAMLRTRVRQLVLTAGGVSGVRGVQVLIEGGRPLGVVPGLDLSRPVTVAAVAKEPVQQITTERLQEQLVDLGFLSPNGVTGELDDHTSVATIAFQKWSGLQRDGVLGPDTISRLLVAARPEPLHPTAGRKVEVLLDRQVALLEQDGKVVRTVHISTGAPGTRTPAGSFRVYRKERMSWSIPFETWMPWASYFTGGIAFHQYPSVPVYPASHGCVRVNRYDAPLVYEFAAYGTPVEVLWRS
jgi:hypothetical protein